MTLLETAHADLREHSPWSSRRRWSLWDMIKQSIWTYVRLGMDFNDFRLVLYSLEERGDVGVAGLAPPFKGKKIEDMSDDAKEDFRKLIRDLHKLATELNLSTSRGLLAEAVNDLPGSEQAFNYLLSALRTEMHNELILYVPSERSRYYDHENFFRQKLAMHFRKHTRNYGKLALAMPSNAIQRACFTACAPPKLVSELWASK